MKAKELFGLVIRVIGLLGSIWGFFYLMSALYYLMGAQPTPGFTVYHYLLAGFVTLIPSIYFLRGAPHIIRFAYPDSNEQKELRDDSDKPAT